MSELRDAAKAYELHKAAQEYRTAAASKGEKGLTQYERIGAKINKALDQMPRMFKTYGRQTHGYKTTNPEKAEVTMGKIRKKIEAIGKEFQKAHDIAEGFLKSYKLTSDHKERSLDEMRVWLGKSDKAILGLRGALRSDDTWDITRMGDGLGGGYSAPGQNPLVDIQRVLGSIPMMWEDINKPDPDPINIPKGGNDVDRFMAFATPTVRRLAKDAARKLKKDKAKAAILAGDVLEDVNAHSESSEARAILSPLAGDQEWDDTISGVMSNVSAAIDYGVVQAGAFAIILMQEVGEKSYADKLAKTMAAAFAEYTT